ncbi:MAG: glycine cleavage system aminomethyltransferase GcvT [Leucobacter sp.]
MTKHTPLYAEHQRLGASFTDFGGWDMPLKYDSELAEHHAVRNSAGLFDLSHIGEIRVQGPDAAVFLNTALVGNLAAISVGRAKYSLLCTENGGIIDDLISYRLADDEYLVVPNAGNVDSVVRELTAQATGFDVTVRDESADTALVAVQGPASAAILHDTMDESQHELIRDMKYYSAYYATVAGIDVLLARTGYTGEDGFELYVPSDQSVALWNTLCAAGEAHDLMPAGLAARDSLRLEAGMPLYGNELGLETSPFEAGLGSIVSFKKPETFVGRTSLTSHKTAGPQRVLVGLRGAGRRAGRSGYAVLAAGTVVGNITSGQPSPTLGYPIALAYVTPEFAEIGTKLDVDLRGKAEPFEVVPLPFYRRAT